MEYVLRFLIGGAIVSLFAVFGDVLRPKSAAGSHFTLPTPDRDDIVGELRRQEIRGWLLSIPNPGERIKHAASNAVIAAAAVSAPAELSGLVGDGIERAKSFLLEHLHGKELATLRAEAEVVDNVDAAITVAEQQLVNEFEPTKKVEPAAA